MLRLRDCDACCSSCEEVTSCPMQQPAQAATSDFTVLTGLLPCCGCKAVMLPAAKHARCWQQRPGVARLCHTQRCRRSTVATRGSRHQGLRYCSAKRRWSHVLCIAARSTSPRQPQTLRCGRRCPIAKVPKPAMTESEPLHKPCLSICIACYSCSDHS